MRSTGVFALAVALGLAAGGTALARDDNRKPRSEQRLTVRQESHNLRGAAHTSALHQHTSSYAGTPSSYRIGRSDRETKAFFDHISSYGE